MCHKALGSWLIIEHKEYKKQKVRKKLSNSTMKLPERGNVIHRSSLLIVTKMYFGQLSTEFWCTSRDSVFIWVRHALSSTMQAANSANCQYCQKDVKYPYQFRMYRWVAACRGLSCQVAIMFKHECMILNVCICADF